MTHRNREKRAAKKARDAAKTQELFNKSYNDGDDEDDFEDEKPKRKRRSS